jgi:hypothetical protein
MMLNNHSRKTKNFNKNWKFIREDILGAQRKQFSKKVGKPLIYPIPPQSNPGMSIYIFKGYAGIESILPYPRKMRGKSCLSNSKRLCTRPMCGSTANINLTVRAVI